MPSYPFSVKDCRIALVNADAAGTTTGPTYQTAIDFVGVQELSLAPDTGNSVDLRGDDTVLASSVTQGAMRFTLRGAGIPIAALKVMYDMGFLATGTAPNNVDATWEKDNASPPFFQIIGLAQAKDGGEVLVWLPRCQVQGTVPPVGFVDGAFTTSEISGTAYFTNSTFSTASTAATPVGWSLGAGTRRVVFFQRNGSAVTGIAA